jgi:hypothetical protein
MNQSIFLSSLIFSTAILFNGCGSKVKPELEEKAPAEISTTRAALDINTIFLDVNQSHSLHDVVETFRKKGYNIIYNKELRKDVDKNVEELLSFLDNDKESLEDVEKTSKYLFKMPLSKVSFSEIFNYIEEEYSVRFELKRKDRNLYIIREVQKSDKSVAVTNKQWFTKSTSAMFEKIDNKNLKIKGNANFGDILKILNQKGYQIQLDLKDREEEILNIKIHSYNGDIKKFIKNFSSQNNIYVYVENDVIVFRDSFLKYYDLDILPVKVSFNQLSPSSGISGGGAIGGTSSLGVGLNQAQGLGGVSNSLGTTGLNSGLGLNSGVGGTQLNSGLSNNMGGMNGMNMGMSGAGMGGGSGGIVIQSDESKPLDDLDEDIKMILGDNNIYRVNRTNSTVFIESDYKGVKKIDSLIENFNRIYGKSVNIDMYIYEVSTQRTAGTGVDLSAIADISNAIKVNFGTSLTSTFAGSGNSLSIKGQADKYGDLNNMLFNFLNKYGETNIVTKPTIQTVNNLPISMNLTNQKDYVKQVEERTFTSTTPVATTAGAANVSDGVLRTDSNIQPSVIETGFKLILKPRIGKDGKIKISLDIMITKLDSLLPYEYGTKEEPKTIQLANVATKSFKQVLNLDDNGMAIVGGYIYNKDESIKDMLPGVDLESDSSWWNFLTGSEKKISEKVEMIIALKATIIE